MWVRVFKQGSYYTFFVYLYLRNMLQVSTAVVGCARQSLWL